MCFYLEMRRSTIFVHDKSTVKPVLRGHLWDKEKWPYKTGDLLKDA